MALLSKLCVIIALFGVFKEEKLRLPYGFSVTVLKFSLIVKCCCPSATTSVLPQSMWRFCCQVKCHDTIIQSVESILELGPTVFWRNVEVCIQLDLLGMLNNNVTHKENQWRNCTELSIYVYINCLNYLKIDTLFWWHVLNTHSLVGTYLSVSAVYFRCLLLWQKLQLLCCSV